MSIVSVNETWNNRRGSQTDTVNEYERVFRVVTDDPTDGVVTVLQAPGIPAILDGYIDANGTVDSLAFCNKREPLQDQDQPWSWLVRCYYTTDITQSPWLAPPEISWGVAKYQLPLYQAYNPFVLDPNGNPLLQALVNTAGEMFDPAPTADDSRPTLTIKKNQLTYDPSLAVLYQDAVNTDVFYGAVARQAKVESITAVSKQLSSLTYWEVTYVFHFRRDGWLLKLLAAGFRERVTVGGQDITRAILDAAGNPVSSPWPLDSQGRKITLDFTKNIANQLFIQQFQIYTELPFRDLGVGF